MKSCYLGALLLSLGTCLAAHAQAPLNDNLRDATLLSGTNLTVTGTNLGASKEVGEPSHGANAGGRSVWWAWTAPASGSVLIDTEGSSFDTLLAAYTGASLLLLSAVASNDDSGSLATSAISFNVIAGATYRIVVDGYSGRSGDVRLALLFRDRPLQRPANDDFASRILLDGQVVQTTGANYLASTEPGEPNHAGELGGASVWWSWTAPESGTATVSTQGSSFDTLLGVYTGTVLTNLTLIARNDDISTNQPASRVTFTAIVGTSYEIAIDGFAGTAGDLQLQVSMSEAIRLELLPNAGTGGYQLRLIGPAGKQYALEASADLLSWSPLLIEENTSGTLDWPDAPAANAPRRFYRARQLP